MMKVEVPSVGLMETNIDPCLQKDELIARLIEELVEV